MESIADSESIGSVSFDVVYKAKFQGMTVMIYRITIGRCLALFVLTALVSACSPGGSDNSAGSCDMIANPGGPTYFKVVNNLNSGLEWYFQTGYAFGADMKPGECTNMGVVASQYTIRLKQCNISDAGCTSNFGPTRSIVSSVAQGETYTLTVDGSFF